jgi:hypothetical protein
MPFNRNTRKKAQRDIAYKINKSDPTPENLNKFIELNKQVKISIEADYKNNFNNLINKTCLTAPWDQKATGSMTLLELGIIRILATYKYFLIRHGA